MRDANSWAATRARVDDCARERRRMTGPIPRELPPADDGPATGAIDTDAAVRRIDLPSIVAAQVDQAARTVPSIASLPDEVRDGPFAEALGRASEHVLRAFLENRPHTEHELEDSATRFAEVMAVWGLTIDDIVAAFAQGAQILWNAMTRHAVPDQLRKLLLAGGHALDSAALVERIARRSAELADAPPSTDERAARAALARLVDDRPREPDPSSARMFAALRPNADLRGQAALAAELREIGLTAATGRDHVVGSLPAGMAAPDVDDAILVVEAQPRPGRAQDRAQRLREMLALADDHGHLGRLDDIDLGPECLLAAAPPVARRLRAMVTAVDSAPFGAQLLETAAAFVAADGAVAATAQALSLHRESVRHRIGRIQRLTGLDLGSWHGRCVLSLALRTATDGATATAAPTAAASTTETPADDGTAALRAIISRVDRPRLVQDLVERRRADHPQLATTLAASGADVESVEADLDAIVALLRTPRPCPERDLVGPCRRTLDYLRLGVTTDDVLAVGRATPQAVWAAIVDAAADEELRLLPAAINRLIAYIEATQVVLTHAVKPDRLGAETTLLETLLDPEATGPAMVVAATAAGLAPATPCRCLVIVLDPAEPVPAGRIAMDLRGAGWAAIVRGERIYGVASLDAVESRVDERLPENAVAALGDGTPLGEAGRELRHLERLAELAAADGNTGPVDTMASTLESLLISRPDVADAFREAIVAPLERRDRVLVDTLRQYVTHGLQRGPSAAALHLHPNSLDYRLNVIRQEIARSFTTIDDVLAVLLGVTADRLRAGTTAGDP